MNKTENKQQNKTSKKGAYFICRHHKQVPYRPTDEPRKTGKSETGEVYEQWVELNCGENKKVKWRCITIKLNNETRDGDSEIKILTNLPKSAASAPVIADL